MTLSNPDFEKCNYKDSIFALSGYRLIDYFQVDGLPEREWIFS